MATPGADEAPWDDEDEDDDLDRYVARRAKVEPDFPARVEAASRKRQLLRALATKRAAGGGDDRMRVRGWGDAHAE